MLRWIGIDAGHYQFDGFDGLILMLNKFARYLIHLRHILHCHIQLRLDSRNLHSQHLENGISPVVVVFKHLDVREAPFKL